MAYDETLRPALRAAGYVTRDAREVERKSWFCARRANVHNISSVNRFRLVKARTWFGLFACEFLLKPRLPCKHRVFHYHCALSRCQLFHV